ncbi:MAG TPA: cytochrome c oxidase subunit II [Thermomicrobiales bacterium]|nr:cytochrome c oxidase subunit II [Thermomicrobiales bacterium]
MVTLLTLAVLAAGVLLPVVGAESPYSTISPQSPQAEDIQWLYKLIFYLSLIVFIGVQIAIVYTVLRYRRRNNDERPEQLHGNKTIEIIWTVVPAIVLLAVFIPTVRTIYAHADQAETGNFTVEVYAKQWWWEIHYADDTGAAAGVVTANEIVVPQGKDVVFELYSNNVIHSFWVPQLSGKLDVMPGHVNKLPVTTDNLGYYFGHCAEFCGDAHALMRFKVIVQPQEVFDQWAADWKAGPSSASADAVPDGDISKTPPDFGLCLACHQIEGTNATIAPEGLDEAALTDEGAMGPAKYAGPNLTMIGCRTTLAAGVLPNTPENMAKWLHDPQGVKPGAYMGEVIKKGMLSDDQIAALVTYLESLKPADGCPEIPVQPGVTEQVTPANP